MARLRYNALDVPALTGDIAAEAGPTAVTFSETLKEYGVTAIPNIVAPDYLPLYRAGEVVYLTAYDDTTLAGTISRAQEGSTAVAHTAADTATTPFKHGPTKNDIGGTYAYVERTTNLAVTATTEATATSFVSAGAVVFDGSARVKIEMFAPFARPALTTAATLSFYLFDGSTSLGRIGLIGTAAADTTYVPVSTSRVLTPSAGSHTYSIRAAVSTGSGLVGAGLGGAGADMPAYIRIINAS